MPDFLLQADQYTFHLINQGLTNPFFDFVMPWLRNPLFWIPVYIFIISFCLIKYKMQGAVIILLLAAAVGFADFTSAAIIKNAVKRTRPCREQVLAGQETVRIACGTGYSFPSTHATDHFTVAVFLILVFCRRWKWVWFWCLLWAALVSFAQVYVGLHYPADVLGGALYGTMVGWLFALLHKRLQPQFYNS